MLEMLPHLKSGFPVVSEVSPGYEKSLGCLGENRLRCLGFVVFALREATPKKIPKAFGHCPCPDGLGQLFWEEFPSFWGV